MDLLAKGADILLSWQRDQFNVTSQAIGSVKYGLAG